MMRIRTIAVGAVAAAAFAASARAESWSLHAAVGAPAALTLSGSIRLRHEWLDGQFRPNLKPTDELVTSRSSLLAEYKIGAWRVGGEFYDSRAYGAKAGGTLTNNEVNTFEPVQAYVAGELKDAFGPGSALAVQAGRMTLNLGSRRLLAADEYRNTNNGHTGVRLDAHAAGGASATAFYVLPQARLPDDLPSLLDNKTAFDREGFDLELWGVAASLPALPAQTLFDASFIGLDERDVDGRATRNRRLRTATMRIVRNPKPGRFDYEAEAIYQFGTIAASTSPGAARLDVLASFLHLEAGYQYAGGWRPHLSLELDRGSGDDAKADYTRFDSLYGTRRSEFGPTSIFGPLGRSNLMTPGLRLEVTPSRRLDGFVGYKGLWLTSATDSAMNTGIRDPSGAAGRYAGQQVEGRLRYWLAPDLLRLEINGAVLFKGPALTRAPNAPRTGDSHYLSTALTATF